jgi:hypothetical protein
MDRATMTVADMDIAQGIDISGGGDIQGHEQKVLTLGSTVHGRVVQPSSANGLVISSCWLDIGDQFGRNGTTASTNIRCHFFQIISVHAALV